jgi:hypothetical protein
VVLWKGVRLEVCLRVVGCVKREGRAYWMDGGNVSTSFHTKALSFPRHRCCRMRQLYRSKYSILTDTQLEKSSKNEVKSKTNNPTV